MSIPAPVFTGNHQADVQNLMLWAQRTTQSVVTTSAVVAHDQQFQYDFAGNLQYLGDAVTGSATSSPVWKISNYLYDSSGYLLSKVSASGAWDNRVNLVYT